MIKLDPGTVATTHVICNNHSSGDWLLFQASFSERKKYVNNPQSDLTTVYLWQ